MHFTEVETQRCSTYPEGSCDFLGLPEWWAETPYALPQPFSSC